MQHAEAAPEIAPLVARFYNDAPLSLRVRRRDGWSGVGSSLGRVTV